MELIITFLSLFLLLIAAAIAVMACLVIYNRQRQKRTRPVVTGGAQPTPVEETQSTALEEIKPITVEEAQPPVGEEVLHEVKGGRQKPKERGGRPRASTQEREKPSLLERKPHSLKPEIVCWKRGRQWIPAVEVPEDLLENSGLAVLQDGLPLTQDESREACWCVERTFGEVVVRWKEGEDVQQTKVALGQEGYLLFKLSGQDQNQGRRVKSPSFGSYLVMVPDNWERDEGLSGSPPYSPEPVSVEGYRAHFFDLEKGSDRPIAFRTSEGKLFPIESKAPRFELVGTRLNDASEMGPLFGERPPQIRALDDRIWKDVGTIVVGEEGRGRGRWRMAFSPEREKVEQSLPSEVVARKGGWYFLRFYDTNDDLIESLDFRFICALREIRIAQPSPLPSGYGHGPVHVTLLHDPGCAVQSADSLADIQIERQDGKTILTIPPAPVYDKTRWLVSPEDGPEVEVTILVERLWWAVGEDGKEPSESEWQDQPIILSRNDFAATSKKALWLRLPRRRWVDSVLVGFEQQRARGFEVKVTEKTIAVPLREFGDSREVEDRTQKHSLKVWIERDDGLSEGIVGNIRAEQRVVPPERQPEPEPQKMEEDKSLLQLDTIQAPRLATVLTRLCRETSGPLRVLVKEVRLKYSRKHAARKTESREFKSEALCMIALTLELSHQIPGCKKRWADRAQFARDEFPEIMDRLQNRYKEISAGRGYRADCMPDRR